MKLRALIFIFLCVGAVACSSSTDNSSEAPVSTDIPIVDPGINATMDCYVGFRSMESSEKPDGLYTPATGDLYPVYWDMTVTNYTETPGKIFVSWLMIDDLGVIFSDGSWSSVVMAGETLTFAEESYFSAGREFEFTQIPVDPNDRSKGFKVNPECRIVESKIRPL